MARRTSRRGPWLAGGFGLVTIGLVAAALATGLVSPATDVADAALQDGGPVATQAPSPAAGPTVAPSPVAPSPVAPSPVAPSPIVPPPVPASRPELVQQLRGLLAAPGVIGTLAVTVLDEHGRTLLDHEGGVAMLPASTQKLVTAAAALETLGPDHRFRTELRASATAVAGVLAGDLVLVGSGDPALASPLYGEMIYPARPRTPMERLADAVVNLGITRIEGSVVGDARAYPTSPEAEGWFPRYFWDLDARYVSSLTAEAGLDVVYDEETDDLTVELAHDPVLTAATVLRDLLVERGVEVVGEPRVAGTAEVGSWLLADVDSPPLSELLRHTVQRSDNHMADSLLHAVAYDRLGEATWAAGERAVKEALADHDLDWTGVELADGSGLSRANRANARFLAELDAAMYDSLHARTWSRLMAVAGQEGTLRRRLVGTPADGRFTGKTGTLDDVRAIAGTVHGPDGHRYHLSVVGNELLDSDSRVNIRALMDNLALVLAGDLHGCMETTPPYDPAAQAEPPPRSWDCAS